MANPIVSAGTYPVRHNAREKKVIETARQAESLTAAYYDSTHTTLESAVEEIASKQQLVANGTLSAAEVKALKASPIELIAAPGAGKAIIVDEVQMFVDYGSAAYVDPNEDEDIVIEYATGGVNIFTIAGDGAILPAAADAHVIDKPAIYTSEFSLLSIDNEAIQAFNPGTAELTTGDSPILWKILYRVVDLLS